MSYQLSQGPAPNEVFRSLVDPTRRALYEQLVQGGEQNVRTLTEQAGISQAAVSKHLSVLKEAGLVRDRPSGRTVHYSAEPQGLAPLIDWIGVYGVFWRDRFNRLEALLDRQEP